MLFFGLPHRPLHILACLIYTGKNGKRGMFDSSESAGYAGNRKKFTEGGLVNNFWY